MQPSWKTADFGSQLGEIPGELIQHGDCRIKRAVSCCDPDDGPIKGSRQSELKEAYGIGFAGARDPADVDKFAFGCQLYTTVRSMAA